MSRNQWMIVALLATAVTLILGCIGGYWLTYLVAGFPPAISQPAQGPDEATQLSPSTAAPASTPTEAATHIRTSASPTSTPAPPTPTNTRVVPLTAPTTAERAATMTPSPKSGDVDYYVCAAAVCAETSQANYEMFVAVSSKDVDLICTVQQSFVATITDLKDRHLGCPQPSDRHLQAAREYLDACLAEIIQEADCIGRYCAAGAHVQWLDKALIHADAAIELSSLADQQFEAYRTSQ
jgi:hypothetical protein